MKRLLILPLILSACASAEFDTVDEPSLDAIRALPPGVSPSAIRLSAGCYFYETEDGMEPLVARQLSGGDLQTEQLCL